MMPPRLAYLAAAGAVTVALAMLALFALLVFISLPRPAHGGMNFGMAAVTWISLAVVFIVLIGSHVRYAWVLWEVAHGKRFGV
jgi:hypothetical protein